MKKLFVCVGIVAALVSAAQAAPKTKAQLTTEINTNWPDNTTRAITPALLRSTVIDIVNSYYDLNGGSSLACGANNWISGLPTLSSLTCAQPTFTNISGLLDISQMPALASGKVWVGNGSNLAVAVTPSGDCAVSITGVFTCLSTNGTPFGTLAAQNANALNVTGVTALTGLPACSNSTDACPKSYIDALAAGIHIQSPVRLATAAVLSNSPAYSNGASGVGATLISTVNGALSVDGTAAVNGDRILVKNQASALQNGCYTATDVGSAGTTYTLTRCAGAGTLQWNNAATMLVQSTFLVSAGATNFDFVFASTTIVTTVGTDPVSFVPFITLPPQIWALTGADTYYAAGKVGVGLSSPAVQFDVSSASATAAIAQLTKSSSTPYGGNYDPTLIINSAVATNDSNGIRYNTFGTSAFVGIKKGTLTWGVVTDLTGAIGGPIEALSIIRQGFVGVNNPAPARALDVIGMIRIGFYAACYNVLGATVLGDAVCAGGPNSVIASGADPTGVADSKAAFDTVCNLLTHIRIPKGTYKIASNATYTNCVMKHDLAGIIKPTTGTIVTVRKPPEAGIYQIYDISAGGTVTGVRDVYPEWFGAVNDAPTTDNITYLAAADASVAEGGLNGSKGAISRIRFTCGPGYKVSSTFSIHLTGTNPLSVDGCGNAESGILGATGGSFTNGVVNVIGDTSGTIDFRLRDFKIGSQDVNQAVTCLNFNHNTGTFISGWGENEVAGLFLYNCNVLTALYNTRQLFFTRMGWWMPPNSNAIGILADSLEDNSAAGDLDIVGGQVVCGGTPNAGGRAVRFLANRTGANINGWRFHGPVFYNCDIAVDAYAGNGGGMGDHAFYPMTQFESVNQAANYETHGAGPLPQISNIDFSHVYVNSLNGSRPAYRFVGNIQYAVSSISIDSTNARGMAAGTLGRFAEFGNAYLVAVNHNKINSYQLQSGVTELISIADSDHFTVTNNVGARASMNFPDFLNPVPAMIGFYGTNEAICVTANQGYIAVTATLQGTTPGHSTGCIAANFP